MKSEFNPIGNWDIPVWEWGHRISGKMNKEVMYKNLLDFKEVMDKHNVTFILFAGGLLGLIRGGDLIDWDDDIEFICFGKGYSHWKDYYKFGYVIQDMEKKGFYVPDRKFLPWHDISFIRGGEKIEIWIFQRINNEIIYDNIIRFPNYYFDTLGEMEFLGKKWRIPNDPESILEYHYGKDWRTPNPKGSYILARHKYK